MLPRTMTEITSKVNELEAAVAALRFEIDAMHSSRLNARSAGTVSEMETQLKKLRTIYKAQVLNLEYYNNLLKVFAYKSK